MSFFSQCLIKLQNSSLQEVVEAKNLNKTEKGPESYRDTKITCHSHIQEMVLKLHSVTVED